MVRMETIKKIRKISTLVLLFVICSCNRVNENHINRLDEFIIDDTMFFAICDSFMQMSMKVREAEKSKIAFVEINAFDSISTFDFANVDKETLMENHVVGMGKRIIGYAAINNENLLLLSNEHVDRRFIHKFGNLFHPSGRITEFDGLNNSCHSFSKYYDNKNMEWQTPVLIYDPVYYSCSYDGKVFSLPVLTTNPYDTFVESGLAE